MDIREENISDEELVKKYRELDEIKWELHEILKELVLKTGIGDISDDYTDTVEFNLGDITIYSGSYYHELMIETDEGEIDLNHDLETAKKIFNEVKKRNEKFDEETKGKKKVAEKIFVKEFKL